MSLFQALHGYPPPSREIATQETTIVVAVKEVIKRRANMDQLLQTQLESAEHRMKQI